MVYHLRERITDTDRLFTRLVCISYAILVHVLHGRVEVCQGEPPAFPCLVTVHGIFCCHRPVVEVSKEVAIVVVLALRVYIIQNESRGIVFQIAVYSVAAISSQIHKLPSHLIYDEGVVFTSRSSEDQSDITPLTFRIRFHSYLDRAGSLSGKH